MTRGRFVLSSPRARRISSSRRDDEDFVYYVIADNPRGDTCYYPDSGKWVAFKEGAEEVIAKGVEADYYEGEE